MTDEPVVALEVMCDPDTFKRIKIRCRCGLEFKTEFPAELGITRHMAPVFRCTCGQRYTYKLGVIARLDENNKLGAPIVAKVEEESDNGYMHNPETREDATYEAKDEGKEERVPDISFLQPPSRTLN